MTKAELEGLAQWLQVVQSVVAIIGLPVLTLTLLMIWRQAQYTHHAAMAQIYQHTANGFAVIQRYFMDNPEYRPYFYDGKPIDVRDPDYVRVSAIAEFFLHEINNLTIYSRYMPEYPWHVWRKSIRDSFDRSPVLQQFLRDHPDWYTDEVHTLLTGAPAGPGVRPMS